MDVPRLSKPTVQQSKSTAKIWVMLKDKWNWHRMHHMGRDELVYASWKSWQLLAVVSLSFGIAETNCSQGTLPTVLQ